MTTGIIADFSATTSREGFVSLSVSFQDDTSVGTPIYRRWNFGDGTLVEGVQNPTHIYTAEGIYNVSLFVRDALGFTDTLIREQYVIANSVHVLAENTIIQSQETGANYWRLYIDENLHLCFRKNNLLYKTIRPAAKQDEWMLVEFHPGDNFFYIGLAETERAVVPSAIEDLGVTPTVTEDRTFVARNSSMYIDELKMWGKEVDLRSYYRSLKAKAYLLNNT